MDINIFNRLLAYRYIDGTPRMESPDTYRMPAKDAG